MTQTPKSRFKPLRSVVSSNVEIFGCNGSPARSFHGDLSVYIWPQTHSKATIIEENVEIGMVSREMTSL